MTDASVAALARVQSGIPGLDAILEGGFLQGGLYIIQGPPGTGKTTFGNQICFNHVDGCRWPCGLCHALGRIPRPDDAASRAS